MTLAALRWCTDVRISLTIVDPDGTLTAMTTSPNPNDSRLRRVQATALGTPLGINIAQQLIVWKLEGQASVLNSFDCPGDADQIRHLATTIQAADTITLDRLRELEAAAAISYFAAWSHHARAQFATQERTKVPPQWLAASPRKSPLSISKTARRAADPVNAILNYAYTLGEAVIRQACLIVGLDPALGIMHNDKKNRGSLALDILEPLRPIIDGDVLHLLTRRRFRRVDFTETPDGQCRLVESVTHELTSGMPSWAAATAPTVEWLAHTLAETSPFKITKRTPLTQQRHLDARANGRPKRGVKPPERIRPTPTCRDCGTELSGCQTLVCSTCWKAARKHLATARAQRGLASRMATKADTGEDPTQTPAAQARRSEGLRRERKARAIWEIGHGVDPVDRGLFTREILPGLVDIPLSRITGGTGLSLSAASRVRRGLLSPHPRHWNALRALSEK